jgi:hypothetical protein
LIRSTLPTDVPPYFWTMSAMQGPGKGANSTPDDPGAARRGRTDKPRPGDESLTNVYSLRVAEI